MHEHSPLADTRASPDHVVRARGLFGAQRLQLELEVLHVREPHLLQAAGAAAAVLEVHLRRACGCARGAARPRNWTGS